jgi:tetratricopeptide (TPR) repeat protein
VANEFYLKLAMFNPPLELRTARLHHFRGQIEEPAINDESSNETTSSNQSDGAINDRHGSKHYYLDCRNPEGEITAVQQELNAWFDQDRTMTRIDLIRMLLSDMRELDIYRQRRSHLEAGDIDPAEQFYRQRLQTEALDQDPEAVDDLRLGQRELLPEELDRMRFLERRLKVLSPATRDWIKRLPPEMLTLGDEQRGDFITHFKQVAAAAKHDATWWLAICTLEAGDLGVAANYLKDRVAVDTDSPWSQYANHQLGRVYESAGQRSKAIEYYQNDQSPQRAGSLVRAKRLSVKD